MPVDDDIVFHKFIEEMEEACRPLGLYLMSSSAGRREFDVGGPSRPLVGLKFIIGDEAFSDRVQHPEKYSDDAMLASMEHGIYEDDARQIAERFAKGILFEGDEDDD